MDMFEFHKSEWATVHKVNEILLKVRDRYEVSCYNNSVFGGDMLHLDNSNIVRTTIAHRYLNKFERPDTKRTAELRAECEDAFLQYDSIEGESYDFYRVCGELAPGIRRAMYHARLLVREWLSAGPQGTAVNYKRSKDVDFTPGETFNSLKGLTSMYQKLRHKSSWTVTANAADDFIKVVYGNRGLKQAAKTHFKALSRSEAKLLNDSFSSYGANRGFLTFRYRMYTEVLEIVNGSRASSVYKNLKTRRFINIEPFGNVILQRQVGLGLRPLLKALGNDLETGQEEHKKLIECPYLATIDLSKASDSTWMKFVKFMLEGTRLYEDLMAFRSPYVLLSDGTYVRTNKLSSMGNGFTFEIMTLLLLAMCRTLDPSARVYGDDIIIRNRHANQLVDMLKTAGYNVNKEKTFISSRFRESCGSFYLDSVGYISCFDIKYCENMENVCTVVTKLQIIKRDHPVEFAQVFGNALKEILEVCPALFKGPLTYDLSDTWVQDSSSRRLSMRDADSKRLHQDVIAFLTNEIRDYQLGGRDRLQTVIKFSQQAHCASKILYTADRLPLARDICQAVSWIKAGRVVKDTIRFNTFSTASVYLVGLHGTCIHVCDVRNAHKVSELFSKGKAQKRHSTP